MDAKSPDTQKHTPESWEALETASGTDATYEIRRKDGLFIADVACWGDARLIAAAPDLYRIVHEQREVIADLHWALEAFLSYERHGKRGGTRAFSKANAEKLTAILSAARAAITKATQA